MFDFDGDNEFPTMFDAEHPPVFIETGSEPQLYIATEDGRVFADLSLLTGLLLFVLEDQHDIAKDSGDEQLHAFYDGALRVVDSLSEMGTEVLAQVMLFKFGQTLDGVTDLSDMFGPSDDN